jgi:peptidoglycan L-alanyl-D-glutamate endopeptidase CwlK
MTLDQIIRAVQTQLKVQVDGAAGTETWEAIYRQIVGPLPEGDSTPGAAVPLPGSSIDAIDTRSEKVLAGLLPEVRPLARALVQKAAAHGINLRIISGLRTYAEQDALYAQGRTAPGDKVTNARGGYSNHNFGIAFDVGVFEGSKYLGDSPKYKAAGVLGTELGLEWGGNWKSIVDQPHYQLRPAWAAELSERDMLAELRKRSAEGTPVYS